MLKYMREHAGSWVIKVLLGAIVLVFIFWGVGSFRTPTGVKAAVVNGDLITAEEFQHTYNNMIEQYRQRFRGSFTDDMIKSMGLKKQVMDMLIEEKLLIQEAAKLNLRVSKEELIDTIKNFEVFHRDGQFNQGVYERVLSSNRLSPDKFETLQKNAMLTAKVRSMIVDSVKVSDDEVKEWFDWNDALVKIDYVLFESSSYKNIVPTPEEIQKYYDDHKESYKTEAKVKVQYLHFKPETYEASIQLADQELKDYYDLHTEQFFNPKTVEARHILIKTLQGMSQEEIDKKKELALDIMKQAKEGKKDFAELAKMYSEDPGSKDNGGFLGAFKKEAMVKPFADAAFSMNPGDISEPVLTQFGWHIIKVEKVNEEYTTSFEDAKDRIIAKLKEERARNLAYNDAETVYDSLKEGDNLSTVAADRNLPLQTTDFFTQKGPEAGKMNRSKFASASFSLPVMGISDVLDLGDGYYLIQPIEKIPEEIAPFATVAEKVKDDLIKQKQDEIANTQASELLSMLKNGEPLSEAVKKYNLTVSTTDFFKRNDSIPTIGYEPELIQTAFELSENKKYPEKPLKGQRGYYVIMFNERKLPSPEDFEKQKDMIRKRLEQQKKYKTYETWLAELKKNSQIVIEEAYAN